MRNEEWQKVEELLDAALELEPAERRRFLDEACAPALRREVESLLACDGRADGFLAAPALALSADFFDGDAPEERAGQVVGHYRIIREIGRGGMGAVFLAERADGEFKQEVALKVVRRSLADPELTRRFRREREILAPLNHPNIARLLDGGVSEDGEPFLAMEYVEGVRVDDYCDAQNLPPRERLRLFIEVCRGVSYAHQHLVVHRDLKPSNILVTKEGTPKLLDFGIAKLLDPARGGEQTRTELRAFTPDYASPEQVGGGAITTASDVYSLGVLLDDLLRGARARRLAPGGWRSRGAGQTAATNLSTEGDGRRAGEKLPTYTFVNPELKNIVAMARHEDPARRYSSAAQLAEDVQRYLDGLPVRAQKDSFTYRAGKFVRRNRAGVAAAALVALSLVVGLAAAIWQANVARRERDRAERRFADVRSLSNALLTDIAPKIERLPGATEARRAVVTQSLLYLDSLAGESADDPVLQSELASAYEKVGQLQGNPTNPSLLSLSDALASYEKANAIRRALLDKNPRDFDERRLLADNHRALGDIRWQTLEPAESLKNSEAALRLYAELLAERPGSPELRLSLAGVNNDIAKSLAANEKYVDAIDHCRRAVALVDDLRRESPDSDDVMLALAESHKLLGNALSWEGRQEEAEVEMAKAVAINEELLAARPDDVRLRTALHQVYMTASSVHEEVNDPLSNEFAFKALKAIEEVVARDPANVRARWQLARSYSRLGVTLNNTGRQGESVVNLGKAVAVLRGLVQAEAKNRRSRHDLATAHIRLGDALRRRGDFSGALSEFEQADAILSELIADDPEDNASLRNLANVCDSMAKAHEGLAGRPAGDGERSHKEAALRHYRRALDILTGLESRGALSKIDGKLLAQVRSAVARYEK